MSEAVKHVRKFLPRIALVCLSVLPALATHCQAQAFMEDLRYPLVVGGGEVTEMNKALGASLQGPSYLAAWDCNDHITAEAKFESLSNKPDNKNPYAISERQMNGALQEHVTFGRVTPFISEIYGTGWVTDKDPSATYGSAVTITMGGAVGGEVRIFRGTSVRVSYEVTHWPPVYTYPGGYSRVFGISITQHLKFFGRDIVR
jgi:hypothetical protein